jgi:hypothetical protein
VAIAAGSSVIGKVPPILMLKRNEKVAICDRIDGPWFMPLPTVGVMNSLSHSKTLPNHKIEIHIINLLFTFEEFPNFCQLYT